MPDTNIAVVLIIFNFSYFALSSRTTASGTLGCKVAGETGLGVGVRKAEGRGIRRGGSVVRCSLLVLGYYHGTGRY
jgi:hypothetical protein